jgi:hypothetical protein
MFSIRLIPGMMNTAAVKNERIIEFNQPVLITMLFSLISAAGAD